jgi:hypothetical protein
MGGVTSENSSYQNSKETGFVCQGEQYRRKASTVVVRIHLPGRAVQNPGEQNTELRKESI